MIESNELVNIKGGAAKWIIIGGSIFSFLVGLVDGFLRPVKCN